MMATTSGPWVPAQQEAGAGDGRLFAPATQRNRDAILDVLKTVLPPAGLVLEIASGSGEHCLHFAAALPALTFQPSDPSAEALASIAAWTRGAANIRPPLRLDVQGPAWPVVHAEAVLCINMIHIAPWAATKALLDGAARLLPAGAPLCLYGPFIRPGHALEPGNAAFDASLRERNPEWGLRDLGEVAALATDAGFAEPQVIAMPANNLSVVFRRR
jgi:SAM-dependent methyltransferase